MPPFLVCAEKIQPCFIKFVSIVKNFNSYNLKLISQNSFDVYVVAKCIFFCCTINKLVK